MAAEWYFERWKPDAERPHVADRTSDFDRVHAECAAALKAGEIFRVMPPIGTQEQMEELAKFGVIERI